MQTDVEFIKEQSRCIAHEIRNQISIVDVYCEIVKKHLERENVANQQIENALKCIQKSAKMVNNSLFDLKSLNNIEPKICDLQTLVLESVDLARVYIHEKDIRIITNLRGTADILVDENKFLACMINIVKNAIEAINETGVITITAKVLDGFASIKISNNGKKISEAKIKDIFTEGFTTKRTGSGLGLFICKNNLKAQNADLKLIKSNNHVTEFEITIPVKSC